MGLHALFVYMYCATLYIAQKMLQRFCTPQTVCLCYRPPVISRIETVKYRQCLRFVPPHTSSSVFFIHDILEKFHGFLSIQNNTIQYYFITEAVRTQLEHTAVSMRSSRTQNAKVTSFAVFSELDTRVLMHFYRAAWNADAV